MSGNGFLRLLFRSEIRRHEDAGKSLPLSPVSSAERTRLRGAEAPQRKPRAAPAKAGSEGMSKRGFLRLLLRPEIQLHGDAEKKASLCHPCRQPSAPACGVPRRRNGSRAQRRQREVWRECRNEDFSGCYFARKYNCMGTPKKKPPFVTRVASRAHPLAECRGAATEAARSAGKGRFGGNVETRISPAVTSPGNTTAWGRRRNPTARGSCSPRSGGKAP